MQYGGQKEEEFQIFNEKIKKKYSEVLKWSGMDTAL